MHIQVARYTMAYRQEQCRHLGAGLAPPPCSKHRTMLEAKYTQVGTVRSRACLHVCPPCLAKAVRSGRQCTGIGGDGLLHTFQQLNAGKGGQSNEVPLHLVCCFFRPLRSECCARERPVHQSGLIQQPVVSCSTYRTYYTN